MLKNLKPFTIGTLDRLHKVISYRLNGQGTIRPTIRTKWNSVWAKNYRERSDLQMIQDIRSWLDEAEKNIKKIK